MRNDGSARTVSIRRPTTTLPGNGTNASTIARNVPRTRQPRVDVEAIATVRHSAPRKDSDESTNVQLLCVPSPFTDSRHTLTSGYAATSRTINSGGAAHQAATDLGGTAPPRGAPGGSS